MSSNHSHTHHIGTCSYLLPQICFPGPPGSLLSPPPPGRAFQKGCQPWLTTPHHGAHPHCSTPNTVFEEDRDLPFSPSLSVCPWFSPLSAKAAPHPPPPSTCSWRECVWAMPGWTSSPLHEWEEMQGLWAWAKKGGGREWGRKREGNMMLSLGGGRKGGDIPSRLPCGG